MAGTEKAGVAGGDCDGDEIMDTGQGRTVQGLVSSWQSILRAMGGGVGTGGF